ncbi:MAG: hypothetical protein KDC38_04820 [Planctomycetes bacterium]|nr:hypothetical protein [Planctomycetota bacterium]
MKRDTVEPTDARWVTALCPRCLEFLEFPHPWDVGEPPPYFTGCPACGSTGELKVQAAADGSWADFFLELHRPKPPPLEADSEL